MKMVAQTVLVAFSVLGLAWPAKAAEGWLLLVPPVDQAKLQSEATEPSSYSREAVVQAAAGAFLAPEAPLQQWEQFRAFDSATTCEQWRSGLGDDVEHYFQAVVRPEGHGPSFSLEELLIFIRFSQGMESRCLPVSVVYLPKP